mgnify:FL=1|jgi:hypothetical protein
MNRNLWMMFYQKDTGGTVLGTARSELIPAGRLSGSVSKD